MIKKLGISFMPYFKGGKHTKSSKYTKLTPIMKKYFNRDELLLDLGHQFYKVFHQGYKGITLKNVNLRHRLELTRCIDGDTETRGNIWYHKNKLIMSRLGRTSHRKFNEDPISKKWINFIKLWYKKKLGIKI